MAVADLEFGPQFLDQVSNLFSNFPFSHFYNIFALILSPFVLFPYIILLVFQIIVHYNNSIDPERTPDKLQLIVVGVVERAYKIRWLTW